MLKLLTRARKLYKQLKQLTRKEKVKSDTRFQLATRAARTTRIAADSWNIRQKFLHETGWEKLVKKKNSSRNC